MSTSTSLHDSDKTYAIEELQASVPIEVVLLEVLNRATQRKTSDDPFAYALAITEEACIDVDLEFDRSTAITTLQNGDHRSHSRLAPGDTLYKSSNYTGLDDAHRHEFDKVAQLYQNARGYIVLSPDTNAGIYNGEILEKGIVVTVQKTGPETVVLHATQDLKASTDCANCAIRYTNGAAAVHAAHEYHENERLRDR